MLNTELWSTSNAECRAGRRRDLGRTAPLTISLDALDARP
jgi:hypothetical protein